MAGTLALGAEGAAAAQSAPARSGAATNASAATATSTAPAPPGSPALVLPNAGTPILLNAGGAGRLQTLHSDGNGATSAAGHATAVVPQADVQPSEPSTAPGPKPEVVIRAQINPPARACFENDPASKSTQLARLVTVIKLTPAGDVDSVIIANNYGLSPAVVSCITSAARAAKFAPPGSGGAVTRAEFTFPWREEKPPTPPPAPPAHPSPRTKR